MGIPLLDMQAQIASVKDELDAAIAQVEEQKLDGDDCRAIVLGGHGWHPGVIGIVASRIVEETWRPVVMISLEGNEGKGSGRSIPAFDLHAGLSECRDLFVRFGGHRTAAGLTIDRSRLEEFEQRFDAVAHERLSMDDLVPEVKVDVVVPLSALNGDLETLLRHFEPHGVGNATPVFAITGAKLGAAIFGALVAVPAYAIGNELGKGRGPGLVAGMPNARRRSPPAVPVRRARSRPPIPTPRAPRRFATTRARMSVAPPGANGTSTRAPGRAAARSSGGTAYVKVRGSGSGRAT